MSEKTDTSPEIDETLLAKMLVSPCISVCVVDEPTGYCKGCWRTTDEIAAWPTLLRVQRMEVLERLAERRGAKSITDRGRGPMLADGDVD